MESALLKSLILELLSRGPLSKQALLDALGCSRPAFVFPLGQLIAGGYVERQDGRYALGERSLTLLADLPRYAARCAAETRLLRWDLAEANNPPDFVAPRKPSVEEYEQAYLGRVESSSLAQAIAQLAGFESPKFSHVEPPEDFQEIDAALGAV